ncbi:hypothetical protein [Chryseobacterium sp. W4I1]|uniref:hypothetical protein n=1 Tax=Chryseobacterium sp. W4I1 TaxID=3042293 RepID=UPI002780BBE2|nr:hypothetical protein [Chryseobacterium sp. W4I1]MDQ0781422.1 hypothetical protein [Chryseobacterium sp. W4I1]
MKLLNEQKKSDFIFEDLEYLSLEPWQIWKSSNSQRTEAKEMRALHRFVTKLRERDLRSIVNIS